MQAVPLFLSGESLLAYGANESGLNLHGKTLAYVCSVLFRLWNMNIEEGQQNEKEKNKWFIVLSSAEQAVQVFTLMSEMHEHM